MTRDQKNISNERFQALLAEHKNLKAEQEMLTVLCLLLASALGLLLILM